MDMGLQDKVAIITGGSYGIGKAAAMSMAEEGARVVIVARRSDVLDDAAQDIRDCHRIVGATRYGGRKRLRHGCPGGEDHPGQLWPD